MTSIHHSTHHRDGDPDFRLSYRTEQLRYQLEIRVGEEQLYVGGLELDAVRRLHAVCSLTLADAAAGPDEPQLPLEGDDTGPGSPPRDGVA